MRLPAAFALLILTAAPAAAQQPPADSKSTAPLTQNQTDLRDAAAVQIELLNRQNQLLEQMLAQTQRGVVTYPISMPLPGPINCQGNCRLTVAAICRTVKYPNSIVYPATVPGDTIGAYVNGVCYGP